MKTKSVLALIVLGALVVLTFVVALRSGGGPASLVGGSATVALVRIEGTLATGVGSATGLLSAGTAGSDAIVSALSEARQDPAVKAVVLRVNSPGGSPAASQEIAEEIAAIREEGKVVVTSMGDVAASGAYWIAAATDYVMADGGTMTGSIGVIMEVASYEELYKKLGIGYTTFTSGPFKDMGSPNRPVTPEEKALIEAMIDDLYRQFVDVVAAGRNMSRDEVLALADGRVFTGTQALDVGLIDGLGGLKKATAKAAEMAGIQGSYQVREFGRRSAWEMFLGEAGTLIRGLFTTAPASGALEGPK